MTKPHALRAAGVRDAEAQRAAPGQAMVTRAQHHLFGVNRHDDWVLLRGCQGMVAPALMLVAGDLCGDEVVEGRVAGSSGAVA